MPSGGDDKPKLQLFIENAVIKAGDALTPSEEHMPAATTVAFMILLCSFVMLCLSFVAPDMNCKIVIGLFISLVFSAAWLWKNV